MAICLKAIYLGIKNGTIASKLPAYEVSAAGTAVDPNLTAVQVLMVDPSVSNLSACTYVAQSGAEMASSLYSLSAADGGYLSAMIITVWSAAYGIRQVINVIRGSTEA